MPEPDPQKVTYRDYLDFDDDQRWEIIGGEAYAMSPGARPSHQRLVLSLGGVLKRLLAKSSCEAFVAPIDVKLSDWDVVQPDLVVVCDPEQVTDTCIEGSPRMVVEVLSPTSVRHDRVRKFNLYAKYGIAEYWLVTPEPAMLEIFTMDPDGVYRVTGSHTDSGLAQSVALPGVTFDLAELFGPPQEYPNEVREVSPPFVRQG